MLVMLVGWRVRSTLAKSKWYKRVNRQINNPIDTLSSSIILLMILNWIMAYKNHQCGNGREMLIKARINLSDKHSFNQDKFLMDE